MDMFKKIPVREQDPQVRATNFEEVCLGYNEEEAKLEASRCLNCKNARCVQGCPVNINIPAFVEQVKNGVLYLANQLQERCHHSKGDDSGTQLQTTPNEGQQIS